MSDREFVGLVATMRKHQRDYFRNRSDLDLRMAKQYERRVDDAVRERRDGRLVTLFGSEAGEEVAP